jgi:hypothetical protein
MERPPADMLMFSMFPAAPPFAAFTTIYISNFRIQESGNRKSACQHCVIQHFAASVPALF